MITTRIAIRPATKYESDDAQCGHLFHKIERIKRNQMFKENYLSDVDYILLPDGDVERNAAGDGLVETNNKITLAMEGMNQSFTGAWFASVFRDHPDVSVISIDLCPESVSSDDGGYFRTVNATISIESLVDGWNGEDERDVKDEIGEEIRETMESNGLTDDIYNSLTGDSYGYDDYKFIIRRESVADLLKKEVSGLEAFKRFFPEIAILGYTQEESIVETV